MIRAMDSSTVGYYFGNRIGAEATYIKAAILL
jgi:hypothetical protein